MMASMRLIVALVALAASAEAFAPVSPTALRAAKPAALAGSRSALAGRVIAPMARPAPLPALRKQSALSMAVSLPAGTPLKVGVAGEVLRARWPVRDSVGCGWGRIRRICWRPAPAGNT